MLLLSFLVTPVCGTAQVSGRLTSGGKAVAYAHIRVQHGHVVIVSDIEGWFEVPDEINAKILTISCIGFRDTLILLDTLTPQVPVQIVLHPQISRLPEFTISGNQPDAQQILKMARKVAVRSEVHDTTVIVGRAGEYSWDNGRFMYAIEGDYIHLGPTLKMDESTQVTALYKCSPIERNHGFNTDGIDFLWVSQRGAPSQVIQAYHLNQAAMSGYEWMDGALHYRIECADPDSTELSTFIIRQDNYALVSAQMRWPKPSSQRSRIPGGEAFQQVQNSEYHFDYVMTNNQLLLARAYFEQQIQFYENQSAPVELDHKRYVVVENYKVQPFGTWPISSATNMKGLRTLKQLNMESNSWEDRAEKSNSPFIQKILKDMRASSGRLGN